MGDEIKAMELNDAAIEETLKDIIADKEKNEAGKDKKEVKKGNSAKKDGKPEIKSDESPEEVKITERRVASLNRALSQIEKDFGKGAIMRWGEKVSGQSIDVVPTGCLGLDVALGVGGLPRGRIVEIFGPEASGKTTITLHAVAEVQKMKGIAAFIDAEHALDPIYAKRLGVNIDDLYISQPDNGEQALDIAEEMVRSGAVDIIVIDSVAALVPRSEIEGEMGQATMGVQARLMSQALRKLTAVCGRTNTIIIFTNQLRANIGGYGPLETTTGGRALKFYASIRLDIRKISGSDIKEGGKIIGHRTIVKVAKNKVAPPFKTCEFDVIYGKGVSYEGDVLDIGVAEEIVNKGGSWFSYNEHRLGQGRENAKEYLRENPEVCEEIANAVRARHDMKTLEDIRNTPLKEAVRIETQSGKKGKGKGKPNKSAGLESDDDDFDENETSGE